MKSTEERESLANELLGRLVDASVSHGILPSSPGTKVYHYTDVAGLHGILREKCLFATHSNYLNDLSEGNFGIDLFHHSFRKLIDINDHFREDIKRAAQLGFVGKLPLPPEN